MNYNEEQLKELAIKIMEDLDNDYYFKDKIFISYKENCKPIFGDNIPKCWIIIIEIPDPQFFDNPLNGIISIYLNDETGIPTIEPEILNLKESLKKKKYLINL